MMNFRTLISSDGESISLSRFGTWFSFLVILATTILLFTATIEEPKYKAVVNDWSGILLTFIGYQSVSKVSKHIKKTKLKEEENKNE